MRTPDLPANETARIQALHALNLLDTPPEDRFDRLTRMARRMFNVPIAVVSLVDADRLWFKSASGLENIEVPRDLSFCAHAILGDAVLAVEDASADARFSDNPFVVRAPHIRFYAGCPIAVGGLKIGTLCLFDHKPRAFDDHDKSMLRDLTTMVENELTAVQLATIDELTGLANRRAFAAQAQQLLNLCRRTGMPATMLYLDLNRFKQVNDRFGHAEGDLALQGFAQVMTRTFRNSDVLGRLGGDEFAVLAANTQSDQAGAVLLHLDEALSAWNASQQRGYELTYSVGAIDYEPTRHRTVADLMARADDLMYEQKHRPR